MCEQLLQIHPSDNVAVALTGIPRGAVLHCASLRITARDDVPAGHKIALAGIETGEEIIKYGAPVGRAAGDITAGTHVHRHNLMTSLAGTQAYAYQPVTVKRSPIVEGGTFAGYLRENGSVGTRNEIWVIPTVGCANRVAERIAARAAAVFAGENLAEIVALTHPHGCSQLGDDHRAMQRILAGLVNHPNAGGVLLVGLGCENNHLAEFLPCLGAFDARRVRMLDCQCAGNEVAEGMALLAELIPFVEQAKREAVPLSRLIIGVKCGGSDAFSGITANPLVGTVADRVVAAGGTVILTEIPEMFGAEHLLMNRCASSDVFEKLVAAVNGFKAYFAGHGQPVYENPSPGNHAGGITTLEEKSLGCIEKGGGNPVVDVLPYGGRVNSPGLNVLYGPGNDIVSETALAAAGAQLLLFTTGRGTPLGSPVPTVKIASNSALARHKPHWIDFDAGALLEGRSLLELGDALFTTMLEIASGVRMAKNEVENDRQIAIWKDGVTL